MGTRMILSLLFVVLFFTSIDARLCPNGKDNCPEWSTCCIMQDGVREGCCPYKNAECCSDKIHCCPPGSKCNTESGSCDSNVGNFSLNWMVPLYETEIVSSLQTHVENEVGKNNCPDGNSCPGTSTCCKMPQGNYGCCPYKDANCCEDREHCCPQHFKCDLTQNRCLQVYGYQQDAMELPLFSLIKNDYEVPSRFKNSVPEASLNDVVCPDKIDTCPSRNTCCNVGGGRFGCCPMSNAVCCPDLKTCCPNSYICSDGGCERSPDFNLFHLPLVQRPKELGVLHN